MATFFDDFDAISQEWARRARRQLQLFDEGQTEALFYAALALRMGIETRLQEYISAAGAKAKGYTAKDLLQKLLTKAPYAQRSFRMIFTPAEGGQPFALSYTGISQTLVKAHGMLGALLHASFFRDNEDWLYRTRLRSQDPPSRSLLDVRDELEAVAEELDKAVAGDLLGVGGAFIDAVMND